MSRLSLDSRIAVGIAYTDYVPGMVRDAPGLVDYVEIPFELLVHRSSVIEVKASIPVVLHCASLSLAGNSEPNPKLSELIKYWVQQSETPWLGEHIAYVRADGVFQEIAEHKALTDPTMEPNSDYDLGNPGTIGSTYNVGYSVSPQMSLPVLDRIAETSTRWEKKLGVPLLLENGPIYFQMPGSTMSQTEFIQKLCNQLQGARLLLDLTHLAITCSNLRLDPSTALDSLPLDRVVEVHVSGAREEGGLVWDDHGASAPQVVLGMLDRLLEKARPRAVTLEYNWEAKFPLGFLEREVDRVREIVSRRRDTYFAQ